MYNLFVSMASTDTIFVRVYESRMDLLRAVIVGAEGTPYHDGLFFFDVFFPSSYPNVPPVCDYFFFGRGFLTLPTILYVKLDLTPCFHND